jgi:molybdopterin-guanine dinucleotide biosynthesis protein A
MTVPVSVVGVLLAGGQSSRMGGGDKCLRLLAGRSILSRIVERLRPQVSELVLNANGDASRFSSYGLPVVADDVSGFAGPLAGIHAGLAWVNANRPEAQHAVTVATDTPFFPQDLVERLWSVSNDASRLRIAVSQQGMHPVIGLWPVALADPLKASLERGDRKVGAWTKEQGAVTAFFPPVDIEGRTLDPFFNINAPADLRTAEAAVSEMVS